MKLAVVIPTYNERENILKLIQSLQKLRFSSILFIVVDDASPDGTGEALKMLNNPQIILISRPQKLGLGSAYVAGFTRALAEGVDFIVQMDADLSHDPQALSQLVQSMNIADVAIGSRYIDGGQIVGWGPWRHFCSRSAMAFARRLLRLEVRDVTSGYRVWRADALRQVLSKPVASNGYAFQEEMLFRAQSLSLRMVEVPITFYDRQHGASKLGVRDIVEFFKVMLMLRKQRN